MLICDQIELIQKSLIRAIDIKLYDLTLRMDKGHFKALVTHKQTGLPVFEAGVVDLPGYLAESHTHVFSKTILEASFMEAKIESDSGELKFIVEELVDEIAYRIDFHKQQPRVRNARQDISSGIPVWVLEDLCGHRHYIVSNQETTAQTYFIKYKRLKSHRLWIGLSNLWHAIIHPYWPNNHLGFNKSQIEDCFKHSFKQTA